MDKERLYLFDTTLRDGAQTQGVDFSVEDKLQIAKALDELGVDYVEGGWPGANPTDTAFFHYGVALPKAKLTAFGMTKRDGMSASNDPQLAMTTDPTMTTVSSICLVGKSSRDQVINVLNIAPNANVANIEASISHVVSTEREALFDAEHFFDGYKSDKDYALECIDAAKRASASWLVLCDTNGGTMPDEVYRIVSEVKDKFPDANLGIHAHNDTGQAAAVSLAAVLGGARQIQGTLNGLGERCGNANMCTLIPNLMLKEPFTSKYEIGVTPEQLKSLVRVSRLLDEILNRAPDSYAPYVGPSAFAHKGGLHSSAVAKDPRTYEHVPPESVGNRRKIPVSDQAGRSNLLTRLAEIGIDLDAKDARVTRLLDDVKQREYLGYAYDGAEASFELLARRALGQVPDYFEIESFRVSAERKKNARGEFETVSEGVVKLNVAGQNLVNVATGNGPVNALDAALRKDLGKYSSFLADLRLADYKVRILTSGTEAVTRVMVESVDGAGRRWSTVGVSPNIVDASFEALTDSIIYKLLRDGAKV